MNVIPLLALDSLLRSRWKPRLVPRLGQPLVIVNNWFNVESSTSLARFVVVGFRVEIVVVWVVAILLRAFPLREVHFPMASIRPGTRLRWCRNRMLTRVYVLLIPPCRWTSWPHKIMLSLIRRTMTITTMRVMRVGQCRRGL